MSNMLHFLLFDLNSLSKHIIVGRERQSNSAVSFSFNHKEINPLLLTFEKIYIYYFLRFKFLRASFKLHMRFRV